MPTIDLAAAGWVGIRGRDVGSFGMDTSGPFGSPERLGPPAGEYRVSTSPPFGWIRVDLRAGIICLRCGTETTCDVPVLRDWLDRPAAAEQNAAANGIACPTCGHQQPPPFPLLQYRRQDIAGLVVALPWERPKDRDEQVIRDTVGVVHDQLTEGLGDGGRIATIRMSWWPRIYNRHLGPFLLGLDELALPESAEEQQRWRRDVLEADPLPDAAGWLTTFLESPTYRHAVVAAVTEPRFLSERWRATIDALCRVVSADGSEHERATLTQRIGRLNQLRLLGLPFADVPDLPLGPSALADAVRTARIPAERIVLLEQLRDAVAGTEHEAIGAATHMSLVHSLLSDPHRNTTDLPRILEAARMAVVETKRVFGPDHLIAHSALLNLAVAVEEQQNIPRSTAVAQAREILDELAPRAAMAGSVLIADIANNYVSLTSLRAGRNAELLEEGAELSADARHITAILKPTETRAQILGLVSEAAVLRSRLVGSQRDNAREAVELLARAKALADETGDLSEVEVVLLHSNIANALYANWERSPSAPPIDTVAQACRDAVDCARRLDPRHPVAIDAIANAGAALAGLYTGTVLLDDPNVPLWNEARGLTEEAIASAEAVLPVGSPTRTRLLVNAAATFGRPVGGALADADRCGALCEQVMAEDPDPTSDFTAAAATNLGQLRLGQGRPSEAADAYATARAAQLAQLQRARTRLTKLGEIVKTADLNGRRALALGLAGRYDEVPDAVEAGRAQVAGPKPPSNTGPTEPARTATVWLVGCDYGTFALIRLPDGAHFGYSIPITTSTLRPLVTRLVYASAPQERSDAFEELERALSADLIDPLVSVLDASQAPLTDVHLIPTGQLSGVPLHALASTDGRCVLDLGDVHYRIRSGPTTEHGAPQNAIALTDPDDDLLFAGTETSALYRWAGAVHQRPEGWSTKSWLLSTLPNVELLHLGCHATSDPNDPMRSSFNLGSGESVTTAELADLHLPDLRLVVAPACQATSASDEVPDELLGVAHALIHAGAGAVVGCLWEADDMATGVASARMYLHLTNAHTVASALSGALRYVARVTRAEMADVAMQRIQGSAEASWLPYAMAMELRGFTIDRGQPTGDRMLFHASDWAHLTLLEI